MELAGLRYCWPALGGVLAGGFAGGVPGGFPGGRRIPDEMRKVVAVHTPSSPFLPVPLARRPSLRSAKTAGWRSFVILVSEVTLTVVSAALGPRPLRVRVIAVESMAEMVPTKPWGLGRGAGALVAVESDWACAGKAANATAVSRTRESFVIDFINPFFVFCNR